MKTQHNVNVVEGEKLRIVCNVVGNPPPVVSWTVCKFSLLFFLYAYYNVVFIVVAVENLTYTTSDGRIKLLDDPEKHIPNAILQIDAIEMTDRGLYKCTARSNVTDEEESDECMVRVKGKYNLQQNYYSQQ